MDIFDQLAAVVGSPDASEPVPYWLNTSLPNINLAISGDPAKGFPGGRLITIAGPESSGKTALATELMVQAQRAGGFAFVEDFEHAFEHHHAEALGCDVNPENGKWYYKKPINAEQGFDEVYKIIQLVRANQLGVTLPANSKANPTAMGDALRAALAKSAGREFPPIVGLMDSIASMIPKAQDIDYSMQNMKTKNMELAMMLSIELKRLARDASQAKATMILLNQLRTNPGIMFGDSSTEPGGMAPRYYASVMLRLRRTDKWYSTYGDNKSEVLGDVVEMFVRKNKVARPFKKTKYVFRTADPVGLDLIGTMIMLGKEAEILGPKGGVTIDSTTFLGSAGSKRHNIAEFEAEARLSPDLQGKLSDYVMGTINPVSEGPAASDEEEEPKGAFAL